jgi:high-affinity nickel-transport protein
VESILVLGLLMGMRHALDADHLAAVATLSTRTRSLRAALLQGAAWGLGHTLSLLVIGAF